MRQLNRHVEGAQFRYDVALSFASENRAYVERVATVLRARGVSVFYDRHEQAALWGKDLYVYLADIYERQAHFAIIFISAAYVAKLWTSHERRSAQARAFADRQEYVLPARFDDSELPGLPSTIGYVDLRGKGPEEFCEVILEKLMEARLPVPRPRHRLDTGERDPELREFASISWSANDEKRKRQSIFIAPERYSSFGEMLDEIFVAYLGDAFPPFSYGSEWLIWDQPWRGRVLLPWESVMVPDAAVHELAPTWVKQSPAELGITPRSDWTISATRSGNPNVAPIHFADKFVLAVNHPQFLTIILEDPKAPYILQERGVLRCSPLQPELVLSFSTIAVLVDRFHVCPGGLLTETGKAIDPYTREVLRQ